MTGPVTSKGDVEGIVVKRVSRDSGKVKFTWLVRLKRKK